MADNVDDVLTTPPPDGGGDGGSGGDTGWGSWFKDLGGAWGKAAIQAGYQQDFALKSKSLDLQAQRAAMMTRNPYTGQVYQDGQMAGGATILGLPMGLVLIGVIAFVAMKE